MLLHPQFLCASLAMWSALGGRHVGALPTSHLPDDPILWIGDATADEDDWLRIGRAR